MEKALEGGVEMKTKPNIVFVISDDHRAISTHGYGNEEVKTDN